MGQHDQDGHQVQGNADAAIQDELVRFLRARSGCKATRLEAVALSRSYPFDRQILDLSMYIRHKKWKVVLDPPDWNATGYDQDRIWSAPPPSLRCSSLFCRRDRPAMLQAHD